ncbi:MAG TPA: 16S rRNA (uracil(1498)-N(3))-methyltransferase [Anaerolineae bacterium]
MHRFFVSPQAIKDSRIALRGTLVHQIRDVLRMRPGDTIVLLDNSGWAHRAELVTIDRDAVRGRVVEKWKLETEPQTRITLYQGLLKGQKFEWVLQKGTEIGIVAFVPVLAARCVIGTVNDVSDARIERWEKIIVEAAEQAGRAALPHLANTLLFAHACEQAGRGGLALIPWEGEHSRGLREALQGVPKSKEISLFIGPEGGFAEEEIATAQSRGVIPVSLGPRILRAETAGLAAASAILYELGDWG